MRHETTEQFHRHVRFAINFRYQPSPDEASYLQPYSSPKDALRYIPDIALAKYVRISNVAAHADPIETWVPLVFKRAHCNNQPTLALLREKTPAVKELHIHFNISGRESGASPLAHLLLDTLRTHPGSLQQLIVTSSVEIQKPTPVLGWNISPEHFLVNLVQRSQLDIVGRWEVTKEKVAMILRTRYGAFRLTFWRWTR
jgi:hypothetical protein